MKYGKTFILLVLAIFLFSLTGAFASEIDTPVASEDTGQLELSVNEEAIEDNLQTSEENTKLAVEENNETLSYEIDAEILTADQFNYTNLKEQIGSGGNINLNKGTYTYNDGDGDTIQISTSGVINGNGAVIDMAQSGHRAFEVTVTDVTIKNLTIKNANYNGNGGAIYFSNSGTVTNCNFTNNSARYGGAIEFDGTGNVTNCNFTNNTATYQGGAIWMYSGSVENCNFTNNSASNRGGAVYFYGNGDVTNCNFTNNKATGGDSCGGAILMYSGNVTNCNFTNNSASSQGGAIRFSSTGTVTNCNFTNNSASGDGGAVYFDWEGTVENCNFTNNTATNGDGGAIWMYSGSVENCNFTNNKATGDYSYGGAILFTGTGNVTNCNFANNRANEGGAIFSWGWYSTADTCIFKSESDTFNNNVFIVSPKLNVDNFTTFYGSCEKLTFNLTTDSGMPVNNGNISISAYFKNNNSWVGNYSCLSGEGWIPDLPVGAYYAIFDTEYAEFQPINRTIKIIPNIPYYVNVTSLTTHNKTVNITAKSNIPQDILEGKLLFIFPDGTEINASYVGNGTWWAVHTFDDYGVYQVNASYVGLDNVTVNNATITIDKVNSTITLDNITLNYGESKNVTVTTEGATGIKANINGTNVTVINNYTIPISDLAAGNYTLSVTTIPDGNHNPVTATSKIIVNKVDSTLTVGNIIFDYGSEGSGDVSFTGASEVTADVVNQPKAVVSVSGKKITVSGLDAGTYTLNVTTVPDENHTAVSKTATITVNKINSTLTINNIELDYGDSINVTVTADGATGITAKIDNVNVTVNDYTIPISGLAAGNYTLTVTTIADDNHNPITKTADITVNKLSTVINLANETLDLKVNNMGFISANLTPASAGNLTFVSSNESVIMVSSEGGWFAAFGQGTATITVSFAGNDNYTAAENKTISVTVTLNDASVSVVNSTLDLKVDDTFDLNAISVPDYLNIQYNSSDESVARVSDYGIVTAVGEGTATITLTVGNNITFAINSTKVTVNVKKIDTIIDVDENSLDLKVGDNSTISATLTPADAGNLTFTSSNSSVVSVDDKGNVKAVAAGKANITVSFAGDDKYAAAENKTIEVTVSKIPTEIIINTTSLGLFTGDDTVIVANLIPADAGNVTFTSSDEDVVYVDSEGNVIAQGKGQAIITLSFAGNNKYAEAENRSITVTVSPADASVTVDNNTLDLNVGETCAINATKHPDTILLDITYTSSNSSVATVDENGVVTAVGEGTAVITVEVGDDEFYAINSTNVTVTVSKVPTEITLVNSTVDMKVGDEVKVNATLTPSEAGELDYTSSDVSVITVNGIGELTAVGEGTANITVRFLGNDKYIASIVTVAVTVNKQDTNVNVSIPENITVGDNSTVNVVLPNDATGNVTVKVDGDVVDTVPVKDGSADVTIPSQSAGNHTVEIAYSGDDKYNPLNETKEITVSKKDTAPEISIPSEITFGDNATVDVKLPSDAEGNVILKVDGKVIGTVSVSNGTASVKLPELSAGNHTVEITYSGDDKYNSASKNTTVNVAKDSTKLTADDVTATYKVDKYLVIKLTDSKGNPLANAPVTVELSASKNYTTDENGQIKVKVSNMVPKTYTAKITFKGDDKYARSDATAKVTVKKATAKITAKAKTFKTTTKIKKYTVTLKANGKALKNKWVYLKVNGKKYKAKTNSKGKATFKITKLNKAGKFKATVTFKGNDYYKKATKKATIKVKSVWKTISKGSKNSAIVKKIQKALKNHGYYLEYNGRYLKVDGIFWDYTEMAVKEFQNDKTLKVTGKVDEKTAKKLGII